MSQSFSESAFVEFLVTQGMSDGAAKNEANRFSDRFSKIITREHNERQIQLEFFSTPRPLLAKLQNCHRTTIYRRRAKIVALGDRLATPA